MMPRKSALAAGLVAMGCRAFYTLIVDMPSLQNSGWIVALLGGATGLAPAFLCMWLRRVRPGDAPRDALLWAGGRVLADGAAILAALALTADAANTAFSFAITASYAALNEAPIPMLTVVVTVAGFICALCGTSGSGGAARLWLFASIVPAAIILLSEMRNYNARWLTPIFGSGLREIVSDGATLGGAFSLCTAVFLTSAPRGDEKGWMTPKIVFLAALTCALLSLAYSLMIPSVRYAPEERVFRLDTLMTNGRSPLSLQFPIMLTLFGAFGVTLAFEFSAAAELFGCVCARLPAPLRAAIPCALSLALALFGWGTREVTLAVMRLLYPALLLPPLIAAPLAAWKARRSG